MKNKAVIRVPCDAVRFSTRRGSPGPNASNGCGDMGDDESGPRRRYLKGTFQPGQNSVDWTANSSDPRIRKIRRRLAHRYYADN